MYHQYMVQVVSATYKNGVFEPDRKPALSESTRVRLVVEPIDQSAQVRQDESWAALEFLWRNSTFNSNGQRLTRDQLHERR